jgi:glycosyltransferase involved in cell wall biosynthesis
MKVSVLVMTYNHACYIAEALESALTQQVSFNYEILVSEDASTDGTREIVVEFQRRHAARIRLLLSERNIRSNEVVVRGIRAARGQYIALLDGDDCWTSPHKLQRQADFLDAHPECAICFHNATVVHQDGSRAPWNWTPARQKPISTLEDLWMGNFIATSSTMFRRGLFKEVPAWYISFFPITDWPLHILNAEHGAIGYLDEVMGVYRYHAGGLYSTLSEAQKLAATLNFYKRMNACLDFKYDAVVKIALSSYFFGWAEEYARRGDVAQARACFRRCLSGRPLNNYVPLRRFARLSLTLYLPSLLRLGRAMRRLAG